MTLTMKKRKEMQTVYAGWPFISFENTQKTQDEDEHDSSDNDVQDDVSDQFSYNTSSKRKLQHKGVSNEK